MKQKYKKISDSLYAKYDKDQLADLLVKHKDQRVSNLIVAAYNRKCMKVSAYAQTEKSKVWDFYHARRRAIGPGSWFQEFMIIDPNSNPWEDFLSSVTDENKKICFQKLYIAYLNEKMS